MSLPLVLTVAESAAILHVSVDTIKRQIRLGLIPTKRIKTGVRISRAWLDSYVAESAPVLMTRRQVSVKLGISTERVRTLQVKGLLTTVRIGTLQRIPAAAVAEYVKRNSFAFLRSGANLAPHSRRTTTSEVVVPVSVAVPSRRLGFSSVRSV